MERGTWYPTVHRIAESRTWPSTHAHALITVWQHFVHNRTSSIVLATISVVCRPAISDITWGLNEKAESPSQSSWIIICFKINLWVICVPLTLGFSGGSDGKESACDAGNLGSIPGSGRSPGERNGNPLQYSCRRSYRWRSLAGYSPWGCKESDMTEQPHFWVICISLTQKSSGL